MALNGDFLFMADTATIAFPETGLATCVGGGATCLLPRLVGSMRARELIYTGRIVHGPEAVDIGLALKSVPVEQLLTESEAILACMNTEDWREGLSSFAENRKPTFKGR